MRYCPRTLHDFVQSHSPFSPAKDALGEFRQSLESYLAGIADSKGESEEHQKNLLRDFLHQSFGYDCNTKDRIDLAIYDDSVPKVLFEVKSSSNSHEFVKPNVQNPNLECKAFYESILYFLRETITNKNNNLTHIVLTDTEDFYIIDAKVYAAFAKDKVILKAFKNCEHKEGNDASTKRFYEELSNLLPNLDMEIQYTHFRVDNSILASCHFEHSSCHSEPALAGEESLGKKSRASKRDVSALPQHDKINNCHSEVLQSKAEESLQNNRDVSLSMKAQHDKQDSDCHSEASAEESQRTNNKESHHILPLLYQVLSPHVLLKRKTYLDANTLNQDFYDELLYILGLKENVQSGKVLILPSLAPNTLLDSICSTFELERDKDFEILFSLLTTWNNRLLFLRLLESMLLSFKHIQKPFLNLDCLKDFQALNTLFFDILAKIEENRDSNIPESLSSIPYLNSSLFEKTALEIEGKEIKLLESKPIILYHDSILYKDKNFCQSLNLNAKDKDSTLPLLEYLFAFLHAYDFTTTAQDIQNHTKMNFDKLINSAVLGLVFEKLNGYKEGSFYTPSFITRYMCKQSLERVVLQKFNESQNWDCQNLDELKNKIDKLTDNKEGYKQANAIFDSIHICDPAVGSGHFLVSALNELILLKFKLGILCDENHHRIKDITLEILRDEIVIRDSQNALFTYTLPAHDNIESHKIQRALFFAKRKLIESCLFGVDINPNSCEITKLRLWIELLKYSYYKDIPNKRLETLPNIDINIKCGNSLISRFNLSDSLRTIPNINFQIEQYKKLVFEYKNADQNLMTISKKDIEKQIETIQATFTLTLKDPKTKKELEKAIESHIKQFNNYLLDDASLLEGLGSLQFNLFGTPTLSEEEQERALESYGKIQILRKKLTLALSGAEYKNAFEWRFAFPEVLDSNGDFLGFDLVIGNPPYMQVPKNIFNAKLYPFSEGKDKGKQNLYKVFIELGYNLGHTNSIISLITQSSIMCDLSAQYTRELLLKNTQMHYFVEFKKNQKIFTNVIQGVCIVEFQKFKPDKLHSFQIAINNTESQMDKIQFESITQQQILDFFPLYEIPLIKKGEMAIVAKVKTDKILLKDLLDFSLQGNINTIHLSKIQSNKPTDILIYKGAHCHRWYLDKEPFYGLDNEMTRKIIKKNQKSYIIATQNITGTTDKYRIYANFTESKNTKIVFLDSCNISYCKNARDAKFLVGLLNSFLLNWLFRITSTNNHVNLYELESLPIPKITKSNQKIVDRIIALVDEILAIKANCHSEGALATEESHTKPKRDVSASPQHDKIPDISNLESEIDKLVYELYNLSDEEINIIENKEQK